MTLVSLQASSVLRPEPAQHVNRAMSCFLTASHVQHDVQDAGLLCSVQELKCSCLHLHGTEGSVVTRVTGWLRGSSSTPSPQLCTNTARCKKGMAGLAAALVTGGVSCNSDTKHMLSCHAHSYSGPCPSPIAIKNLSSHPIFTLFPSQPLSGDSAKDI